MLTILKYELKKIFNNKLVVVLLIISAIVSAYFPVRSYVNIKDGNYAGLMDAYYLKDKPNVTMNEKTYNEMKKKISEIEADNNNYDFEKDAPKEGGMIYGGRFERIPANVQIPDGANMGDNYVVSAEDKAIKEKYPAVRLKKEILPEYLCYTEAVDRYENHLENIQEGKVAEEELKKGEPMLLSEQAELYRNIMWGKQSAKGINNYVNGYALGWILFHLISSDIIHGGLLFILIAVGLSGMFTNEYSTNVDALMFSSKIGRKRKFTASKILASLIYILISAAVVAGSSFVVSILLGGVRGANVSSYMIPYATQSMKMWQMCAGQFLFLLTGGLMAGGITLLVSSALSNQVASLGTSAAVLAFPFIIELIVYTGEMLLVNQFVSLMPLRITELEVVRGFDFFYLGEFYDLRLFVPAALIITLIISIPIASKVFRRHQVGK